MVPMGDFKKCTMCEHEVPRKALVCGYCGAKFEFVHPDKNHLTIIKNHIVGGFILGGVFGLANFIFSDLSFEIALAWFGVGAIIGAIAGCVETAGERSR